MRTWLSAMVIGVAVSSPLWAQASTQHTYSIPCRVFGYRPETPSGEFDLAMVAWLFDEIPITADQRTNALAIVAKWRSETSFLDARSSQFRPKVEQLTTARNARLLELLTNDADKKTSKQCVKRQKSVGSDSLRARPFVAG